MLSCMDWTTTNEVRLNVNNSSDMQEGLLERSKDCIMHSSAMVVPVPEGHVRGPQLRHQWHWECRETATGQGKAYVASAIGIEAFLCEEWCTLCLAYQQVGSVSDIPSDRYTPIAVYGIEDSSILVRGR